MKPRCRDDNRNSSYFMMTIVNEIRPCQFFPEDLDCCRIKMVGGKKYWLVEKSAEAFSYGCTKNCTYMTGGYMKRQALYSCLTCIKDSSNPAGICLACSYRCHEDCDLVELYTKRNFRCDCGNSKLDNECKLANDKAPVNERNK